MAARRGRRSQIHSVSTGQPVGPSLCRQLAAGVIERLPNWSFSALLQLVRRAKHALEQVERAILLAQEHGDSTITVDEEDL